MHIRITNSKCGGGRALIERTNSAGARLTTAVDQSRAIIEARIMAEAGEVDGEGIAEIWDARTLPARLVLSVSPTSQVAIMRRLAQYASAPVYGRLDVTR